MYYKRLGILVKTRVPGEVETRLVPPLTPSEAEHLHTACLEDFFARVSKLKKVGVTVFYSGSEPDTIQRVIPRSYPLAAQQGDSLGERLENAFRVLLGGTGNFACVLGSESPDLPLVYLKRAYVKLKHRDAVVGPTFDGGWYLIGLKRLIPGFFENIAWERTTVLLDTLRALESERLSIALLPPWYDVTTAQNLSLLRTLLLARRIEQGDRLRHLEEVIGKLPLIQRSRA